MTIFLSVLAGYVLGVLTVAIYAIATYRGTQRGRHRAPARVLDHGRRSAS